MVKSEYDMCIDLAALCTIEDNLRCIGVNLSESTERMLHAIQSAQGFLAGQQFEKAQRTTMSCIDVTAKASNNIKNLLDYIAQLKELVAAYSNCRYEEAN